MTTDDAMEAMVWASLAILEAVVDLGSVPSDHLYAVMDVSLGNYNAIVASLVKAGMITNERHVLEPTAKGRRLIAASRS